MYKIKKRLNSYIEYNDKGGNIMNRYLKFFVILFFIFIFTSSLTYYKFYGIENALIDNETNTKTMYTTKSQIQSLAFNNKDFFEEFISELMELDGIEKVKSIQIPFDNNEKYAHFWGLKLYYDIDNDKKLSKHLKYLSRELNIHSIHSFVFTENVGVGNTYIGLKYDKLGHTETAESHNNIAWTVSDSFTVCFDEQIDGMDNWYYVCSRDLNTTFYPFWNRVYDIVKGNLS